MKPTLRKKIARVLPGTAFDDGGTSRQIIVELDTKLSTVSLRLTGCRTRKTFAADKLFHGQLVSPRLTLKSKQTVDFRGKARSIVADIDTGTGQITIRPEGITKGKKSLKTYNLVDLFTWGPQLQLL